MVMAKHVQKVCITTLKKKLDPSLSEALLFLHAISGCDTTSRPHGIGKVTVLKKYAALKNSTYIFMSPSSSKEAIEKAGEKALLVIYGCPTSPNLNSARVKKFQVMVATSAGYVPPEKLPPTTEAASHHSHRTYHQVQAWRENDVSSELWGWLASSAGLVPVRMAQPAAPERLLTTIRCNCGGRCDNKKYTCRKNGLQCTPACGQCKGISCLNTKPCYKRACARQLTPSVVSHPSYCQELCIVTMGAKFELKKLNFKLLTFFVLLITSRTHFQNLVISFE